MEDPSGCGRRHDVTSGGASVGDYDIVAQVMGSDEMDPTFGSTLCGPESR